ncbi:ZPR1 zinc finger domain-containing protein [archaeon]|nr:ZPR1 zinc finger domain-containing protein [archaeon]MBT3450535.1 ZPR1 zinc finger domain-containing protein [archaeon]MBT6868507.1 ZPR1 zinc finger domain-containing protein [archaeon]MBT7193041.1 ZPR1 zinc finger domain-containing protein [archaeon]MBT7381130.1 ZPR1 zinc finger domain-containing protein [archaeon]
MVEIKGQLCNMCGAKKLILREDEIEVPYFGRVFIFSMSCEACGYRKSDLEPVEKKESCSFTLEVSSEDDLNIKIVKSGDATLKIPRIISIEPGPVSNGYISNVEGVIEKVKKVIQSAAEAEDDKDIAKKAKKQIKKLNNVLLGRDTIKLIISDPSGNSAIISDKAQKSKL